MSLCDESKDLELAPGEIGVVDGIRRHMLVRDDVPRKEDRVLVRLPDGDGEVVRMGFLDDEGDGAGREAA